MVTKNYANFVNGVKQSKRGITWKGYITTPEGIERLIDIKSDSFYTGDNLKFYTDLFNSVNNRDYTDLSSSRNGMFFGSGSATPTSNDYKLDNPISFSNTGLFVISETVTYNLDKDTLWVYVCAVKNNSSEPIVISESAMIATVGNLKTNYYVNSYAFLWARDTFEPVTLQPGETRPFTMTIGLE